MGAPSISLNIHFYAGEYDAFAKSRTEPWTSKPSAAIITAIRTDSVNVIVFPDGRAPTSRQNVKYYTEEGEQKYKFVEDPDFESFYQADDLGSFADPIDSINLFFEGELASGTFVYTNTALTTPYIAKPYLMARSTGTMYEVNQVSGELTEVLAP